MTRKGLLTTTAAAAIALVLAAGAATAHGTGGSYGQGGHMMGQGQGHMMEQGQGHMMEQGQGHHMMGHGQHGQGKGDCAYNQQSGEPLTVADVTTHLEMMLEHRANPRLKLGAITDGEAAITAEIVTQDGSLVDKFAVDKATGTWTRVTD